MWNASYWSGINAPNETSTVHMLSAAECDGQVPEDTVFPTNSNQQISPHTSLHHLYQGERLLNVIDGLQQNFSTTSNQHFSVGTYTTKVRPGSSITYIPPKPNTFHTVPTPYTFMEHTTVCSQSESNRNLSVYRKLNSYPEISTNYIYQGQPSVTDLTRDQSWKPINASSSNPQLWKPINESSSNPQLWKPINVSSSNSQLWKPINASSSDPQRYPEISVQPPLRHQTVDLDTHVGTKAVREVDNLWVQYTESGSTSGISTEAYNGNGSNVDIESKIISAVCTPNRRVQNSMTWAYSQLSCQASGTQLNERNTTGSTCRSNFIVCSKVRTPLSMPSSVNQQLSEVCNKVRTPLSMPSSVNQQLSEVCNKVITPLSMPTSDPQQLPGELNQITKSKYMMHNNHSEEQRVDVNTTIKTVSALPRSDFTDLDRTTTKQSGISGQHLDVTYKTGTTADLITLSRSDSGSEASRQPSIQKMTSVNENSGYDCGSRYNVDKRTDFINLDPVNKRGVYVPCTISTDRTPEASKGTTSNKTAPDKVLLNVILLSDFSTRCPQDLITCEVCDEKFQSAEDFNDHLAVHIAVWTAKCDYCDKRFTSQHSCDSHMLIHTGKKPFECDICHMTFESISGYRNHIKKRHNNERTVECQDCSEKYVVGDNYKDDHAKVCIVRRRPYKCDVCDRRFNGIKWLYHHKCTPSEETDPPFVVCEVCDARFPSKEDLETHMVTHTAVWTTKCDYCEKRFTTQTHLDVHMLTHTGGRPFECDICHIVYRKESHWQRHNDMHHNTARRVTCMDCRERYVVGEDDDHARVCVVRRKPYKCSFCEKRFANKHGLFKHNLKHTDPDAITCEVCDAKFQSQKLLEKHMPVHINVWTVKCTICDKRFTIQAHLDEHMLTHTGEKPFECDICHIAYKSKMSLYSHNKGCHAVKKRTRCKVCRKKYLVGDYDNHAKLYHCDPADRRPLKCETCGCGFNKTWKLKRHMIIHSEIRSYLCDTCGKTFKTLNSLRLHSKCHSKDRSRCEKKIACTICGKEYGQPYMHTHMKTHGTEKKFVCEKCGRAFLLRHHLQTHEKSHLDERPYVCEMCGNSFKLPHRLREHKKIHERDSAKSQKLKNKTKLRLRR